MTTWIKFSGWLTCDECGKRTDRNEGYIAVDSDTGRLASTDDGHEMTICATCHETKSAAR